MHEFKKMDQKVKTRWLKALRSGKYEQTTGVLCEPVLPDLDGNPTTKAYCCLGVLCDVTNSKFISSGMPTASQLKKFKLERAAAEELADRNDGRGHSFKKIADFIEKKL